MDGIGAANFTQTLIARAVLEISQEDGKWFRAVKEALEGEGNLAR
jgi:hypothetical protein